MIQNPINPGFFRLLYAATLTLASIVAAAAEPLGGPEVSPPAANVPGGVVVVANPEGTVSFQGRQAMYVADAALVAIPMNTKPGQYSVQITRDGHTRDHPITVVGKQFTEQHITIKNRAMVDPPPETLARIRSESARQRALYQAYSSALDLSNGFRIPLDGITTSLYGHRRFFNGQPRSPHSGLDIAAVQGTPIAAAGSGTVTLADDLYFNGNTVFIDHGQGLVTMYCHMSEIQVSEGDQVKIGDIIGTVGATGRATGPHLHWSVSLAGYRIDPELFTRELNAALAGGSGGS